ncbi:hypothetical protein [Planctomicrobium piriforme]|uniref:Uncharacterized protein n=1 Tax=Planctomicrobium piriforme TaxID=1576369 RepID=A0A1I3AY76_9PLAN|nr:hypothetical protein [Planctomicrobium piriforme]SFH55017.1 hypothetical protein SAMN05421753_101122 [Planctomicrobium piriforme]
MAQLTTPETAPLFDKRLLGTWISDRRRTFLNWKPNPGVKPAMAQKFKNLFGKMTVRYSPKYFFVETRFDFYPGLEPSPDKKKYEVIAKDQSSVVIRFRYEDPMMQNIFGSEVIRQIHFDGEIGYYITVQSGLTEYFRKIS